MLEIMMPISDKAWAIVVIVRTGSEKSRTWREGHMLQSEVDLRHRRSADVVLLDFGLDSTLW